MAPGNENPLMTETPGRRRTVLRDLLLVVLTVMANKLSGGNAGSLER